MLRAFFLLRSILQKLAALCISIRKSSDCQAIMHAISLNAIESAR